MNLLWNHSLGEKEEATGNKLWAWTHKTLEWELEESEDHMVQQSHFGDEKHPGDSLSHRQVEGVGLRPHPMASAPSPAPECNFTGPMPLHLSASHTSAVLPSTWRFRGPFWLFNRSQNIPNRQCLEKANQQSVGGNTLSKAVLSWEVFWIRASLSWKYAWTGESPEQKFLLPKVVQQASDLCPSALQSPSVLRSSWVGPLPFSSCPCLHCTSGLALREMGLIPYSTSKSMYSLSLAPSCP